MTTHAFEIGFGPTGNVIDHSEVWFNDIPGTTGFDQLLPNLKPRLGPVELARIPEQEAWLRHTVAALVATECTTESFRCGHAKFRLDWKRGFETSAIFSLRESDKLAAVGLLISGRQPPEERSPIPSDSKAAMHFLLDIMKELRELQDAFQFDHANRLINMTRRPLLASVFWQSPPDPLSDLRTAQRAIAYAFFKSEGVIA